MIFKTWLKDLSNVQGVINQLNNLGTGASITQMATAVSGLSKEQAILALSSRKLTEDQMKQVLVEAKLLESTISLTTAQATERLSKSLNSEADAKVLLQKYALITHQKLEKNSTLEVTAAKLQEAVANGTLSATEATAIANAYGLTIANGAQTASWKLLTSAIWQNVKAIGAWLVSNPLGWLTLAVGAIAGLTAGFVYLSQSAERAKDKLEESAEAFSQAKSEVENLNSELQTTKQRIDELSAKENLTLVESEELDKLKETNQELERELRLRESIALEKGKQANEDAIDYFGSQSTYGTTAGNIDISGDQLEILDFQLEKIKELEEYFKTADAENKDFLFVQNEKLLAFLKEETAKTIEEFMELDDSLMEGYDEGYLDRLDKLYQKYDEMTNGVAQSHTNTISGVLEKVDFKDNKEQLIELGKNGSLSVETLTSKFPALIGYLDNAGVSAQELYQYIMALANPDAVKYDELKHQLQDAMGFGSGIHTLWAVDMDKQLQDLGLYDEDALEVFATIKAKYVNGETESWTPEDWIANIQEGLESLSQNPDEITDLKTYLDSTIHAEIKEKLLELAKSGEITPETLESTEEYNAILTDLQITAEDATNQILDMLSAQEKLSSASQGLDKLKSAYEEFKDEDIGFVTAKTLESLPDVFKNLPEFDLFSQIVGDPTSGAQAIQQAFNDIVRAYLLSQDTLSGLVGASEHEIQSYIANLKQMGIANAEEVVNMAIEALNQENELINAAEEEYYKAHLEYVQGKAELDSQYLDSTASNNGKLVNALGESYQSDYDNWCDLLSKKAEAYNTFISALESSGIIYDDSLTAKGNADKYVNQGHSAAEIADMYTKAAEADYASYQADKIKQSLKLNLSQIATDFGTSFSPSSSKDSSSSSSSSADPIKDAFEAEYNLLKHKLEMELITEEEYYHAVNALNQKYYAGKAEYLDEYRKYVEEVYKGLKQVQDDYLSDAKAEISHYENLDKYIGNEVTHVQELRSAYETYADDQEERWEAEEEMYKLREQYMERWLSLTKEIYNEPLDLMSSYKDELQSYIDVIESEDGVVGESIYNALIDATKMEIDTYQQRRVEIAKQLENGLTKGLIQEGDTNWYELQQQINECDRAILDSTVSLNEFQDALIDLDWSKFDELAEKIDNVNTQLDELQNLFSDKDMFNDDGSLTNEGLTYTAMVLQERENSIYKLKEIQEELNDLEGQYNAGLISQNEYTERYTELLEMQWDSLQSQLDAENALIDLKKQEYQERIDALQETADEEDRLYQLEKARYELERAKNQKNQLFFNGSEYIYQPDQDAIRDAEKNLRDLELEDTINGLQELIDELEDGTIDIGELLTNTINLVNENSSTVYETLMDYSVKYGITIDENVIEPWNGATNALTVFGKKVTDTSSACTIQLSKVKREINNIRTEANKTAQSIVKMLNPDFENIKTSLADVVGRIALINSAANGAYEAMQALNFMDFSNAYSAIDGLIDKLNSIPKDVTTTYHFNTDGSPSTEDKTEVKDAYWVYKTLKGGFSTMSEATSQIANYNGDGVAKFGNEYLVVKWLKGFSSLGEATSQIGNLGGTGAYKRYATGGKNLLKQLAWTQEYGNEAILSPTSNAILTPIQNGDSVLTKSMTDNLWEWAKMNPIQFTNAGLPDMSTLANVQPKTETTTLQFNGDLSFPNIRSGNDAEKFVQELSHLKLDVLQRVNKR